MVLDMLEGVNSYDISTREALINVYIALIHTGLCVFFLIKCWNFLGHTSKENKEIPILYVHSSKENS